jgi:hypothetical protein
MVLDYFTLSFVNKKLKISQKHLQLDPKKDSNHVHPKCEPDFTAAQLLDKNYS